MAVFQIGALSRATGVKVPTIRFYEGIGLIDPPERTEGNQRRYGDADRERLAFIRHARDLGLSVEAIRDLIRLAGHPDRPCTDADTIARTHLQDVRARMAQLKRLEAELVAMLDDHDGHCVRDCGVLRALETAPSENRHS